MPNPLLYEVVRRQFEMLVASFPGIPNLKGFLEVVPIPETVGPMLAAARATAEMLKAAPSVEFAGEELRADEEQTRTFYYFAMSQLPILREHNLPIRPTTEGAGPFYELAIWILGLVSKRLD